MFYIITNGKQYIRQNFSGRYESVSNFSLADTWTSFNNAKSTLYTLPRAYMRNSFYVAKYENGKIIKCTASESEKQSNKRSGNEEGKSFDLKLYSFDEDENAKKLKDVFDNVENILSDIDTIYFNLQNELSRLDLVGADLYHYYGRKRLNARDGYKMSKMKQEIVLKRMSVKNRIEIIETIREIQEHMDITKSIKIICEKIEEVRKRKYKPRILLDLFENNVMELPSMDELNKYINSEDD